MENLQKAWVWLVRSSADATKWSLTVKAFLTGMIPTVVLLGNFMNVQLDSELLTKIVNSIAELIVYGGGAITTIVCIWGLVRKFYTTLVGTNDVVAGWSYED